MAADACDALAASRILTVEPTLSRVCKSLCLGGLERLDYAQLIFPRAKLGPQGLVNPIKDEGV